MVVVITNILVMHQLVVVMHLLVKRLVLLLHVVLVVQRVPLQRTAIKPIYI